MIDILGTKYKLKENCKIEDYKALENNEAYTDSTIKEIIISEYSKDDNCVKDLDFHIKKVKRHEIIHAFLYESGLDCNTDWATNEEIVDWIAMQFPKINKIFKELDIDE